MALYPKAPSEVRDPYRIPTGVVVTGGLEGDTRFRGELTLVATYSKVFTSDMDATRPATQRWGRHLRMKGGCVILVGCWNYLRLEPERSL